ncbi:MAG: hypothetical protein M0R48_06165 [Candidatus Omnitrophica bacterium]|jgi:hypothetical protein|nr:hypothetical protein [Candidatus Omnitrophota bacterium]
MDKLEFSTLFGKILRICMYGFGLLFLISFCFFIYAQAPEGKVLEYNIGIISPNKIFKKTYEIKEEINNAVSLCDCIEVNVTKKKDSALINVEFDPSEYKGLTIQEIKLLGKQNRVITLRLRAYVEKPKNKKADVQ